VSNDCGGGVGHESVVREAAGERALVTCETLSQREERFCTPYNSSQLCCIHKPCYFLGAGVVVICQAWIFFFILI
jgi:hypothetical protein